MLNDKEGFERFYEQVSILFGSFISEFGNWIFNFIFKVEEEGARYRRESAKVCQQTHARFIVEDSAKDQR